MAKPDSYRIGLFGGSFDPIHNGHLAMAKTALEQFDLDQVFFIPSKISPVDKSLFLPESLRITLIKTAIENNKKFSLSDFELQKQDKSFSYLTVQHFVKFNPQAKFYWLIGYDNWQNLGRWKNFDYLKKYLHFIVFNRYQKLSLTENSFDLEVTFVHDFQAPIEATKIREIFETHSAKEIQENKLLKGLLNDSLEGLLLKYYQLK